MNIAHTVVGLILGVMIGAMDFSIARSLAFMIRASNLRIAQGIVLFGFLFRFTAIGFILWTLHRASDVNFVAVCIALTITFTALALLQAVKTYSGNSARERNHVTDGR